MAITVQLLLLIILTLIMLAVGFKKDEFRSSAYWFQALVALAILLTFGLRT